MLSAGHIQGAVGRDARGSGRGQQGVCGYFVQGQRGPGLRSKMKWMSALGDSVMMIEDDIHGLDIVLWLELLMTVTIL